ncbi:hypothetical protein IC229_12615 [Spirosoma sp. BT702]|uniref:Uncharacterized protein n=1 Tax=Spirosoma profusum TaxID=2771354 RepID=A0A926XWN9_9BACT|nr:hypothetical protein [Spirosoma profusum]MBD2701485.1 hypothetical protein [Spirosoma profusum]
MKQVEKLDLALKSLYEKTGKSGDIVKLLSEKGVDVNLDDAHILGRRLADTGYVKFVATNTGAWVDMKSEGIEFVEGDSFTYRGQSIITNNYHNAIINSPNANLVSKSNQVNITQNSSNIQQTIERIREALGSDSSVNPEKKQELVECLQEVEDGVKVGKAPKYAFKALTELASDFSSVSGFVIQLGQLLGLIAP